jgi:nickel-dependent lactate racemase
MAEVIGRGIAAGPLALTEVRETIDEGVAALGLHRGQRVLAIVPDKTRSFEPRVVHRFLEGCAAAGASCTVLIANGTHAEMTAGEIDAFLLRDSAPELFSNVPVLNHRTVAEDLMLLGTISSNCVREVSGGRITGDIPVTVNRRIFDYDLLVIVGPVFPHEVVGMSGGWKYFFPGIAGLEIINQSHWLGALIGIRDIIGRSDTPVRRLIEHAGEMVAARSQVACISLVMRGHDLHGVYFGDPVASHRAAAKLSREVNIIWTDRRYKRVVAECPAKYDELWTGGKLAYKTQEVVEQGGQIVMYAPHLSLIAPQHPDVERVGYHCLDYFLGQWDRFSAAEPSSLAHSTHVSGPGEYASGVEKLAARRVLASQVPCERCEAINLDYMDPALISFDGKAPFGNDEDTLWVRQAGEQLFMSNDMRDALSSD